VADELIGVVGVAPWEAEKMDLTAWVISTTRWGKDIRAPEEATLDVALRDVYHESTGEMIAASYEEHPNAWLRYGFDEGPVFVLDVYRTGRIVFDQWADQDFEKRLAPESSMNVAEAEARQLWRWLAQGETGKVRKAFRLE
jgi:hypothetical protein